MRDNIAAEHPEKEMLHLGGVRCLHMAKTTLEDALKTMQNHQFIVELPKDIRFCVRKAAERMTSLG